jgi:hypothetical protein
MDMLTILRTSGGNSVDQSFPVRLHYMLNETEKDGLSHVVSWQPHGRCFVVHDQKLFTELILGNYFRQSKYASFQRQLNIYGFQRLTAGPDKGGYYHEKFLRNKPGLAYCIQRFKLKGTKTRKAANPHSEPNFYQMTPLPSMRLDQGLKKLSADRAVTISIGASDPFTLRSVAPSFLSPSGCFTPTKTAVESTNRGMMVSSATGALSMNPCIAPLRASQHKTSLFSTTPQSSSNDVFLATIGGRSETAAAAPESSCENRANFWFLH